MSKHFFFSNFRLFLSFILLLLSTLAEAETFKYKTFYYEVKAYIKDGKKTDKSNDGQFYTFTHNTCYESDLNGIDEGLGSLKYIGYNNEQNIHIYEGTCFYGKVTLFVKQDYSRINIQLEDKSIYVLNRENTPHGFEASNHKAFKQKIDNIISVGVTSPIIIPPVSESKSNTPRSTIEEYICQTCYGSGKCALCHGRGVASSIYTGGYMNCSCSNGICPVCNGKGTKTRIKH